MKRKKGKEKFRYPCSQHSTVKVMMLMYVFIYCTIPNYENEREELAGRMA